MTLWHTSARLSNRPAWTEDEPHGVADEAKWIIANDKFGKSKLLELTVDTYSFPLAWWFACFQRRNDLLLLRCKVPDVEKDADGDEEIQLLGGKEHCVKNVDVYFRNGRDEMTVGELISKKEVEKLLHKKQIEHRIVKSEWRRRLVVGRDGLEDLHWRMNADTVLTGKDFPLYIKLRRVPAWQRRLGFAAGFLFAYMVCALQVFVTYVVVRKYIKQAEVPVDTYIETIFHCLAMLLVYAGLLDEVNSVIKMRHVDLGLEADNCSNAVKSWLMVNALTFAELSAAVVNGFCSTLFILAQRELERIILFTFTLKMIVTIDETIMKALLHFSNMSEELTLHGVTLSWKIKRKESILNHAFSWRHWFLKSLYRGGSNAKIWVALAMFLAFYLGTTQRIHSIYCFAAERLHPFVKVVPERVRLPDEKICLFSSTNSTNSSFLMHREQRL